MSDESFPAPPAPADWQLLRRARRNRNFATLAALLCLVALIFAVTVTRIQEGIDKRQALDAAAAAAAASSSTPSAVKP